MAVSLKWRCLWGKLQKRIFSKVSKDVLTSFCMAGVALCDIPRVSGGLCLHSALYTLHFTLHIIRSTLRTPQSPTSHSTHYMPHLTLHFLHAPDLALQPLPLSLVQNLVSKPCFTKVFCVTAFGFVGFSRFKATQDTF